jgi:hypothetical protein
MANPTIVGQQENYGTAGGIVEADITIYPQPTDVLATAWLVGTPTITTLSSVNVNISPFSQSYGYQVGTPTVTSLGQVNATGQQINWQLGHPIVSVIGQTSVAATGQQVNWAFGNASIITLSFPIPNPGQPAGFFLIEGCPVVDTMTQIESQCGQITISTVYRYDGTISFNGVHSFGGS